MLIGLLSNMPLCNVMFEFCTSNSMGLTNSLIGEYTMSFAVGSVIAAIPAAMSAVPAAIAATVMQTDTLSITLDTTQLFTGANLMLAALSSPYLFIAGLGLGVAILAAIMKAVTSLRL